MRLLMKIGFDAGRCLAAVHNAHILWGSFLDYNYTGEHCNAHTDNLIVLPPALAKAHRQTVSCLDFDMAMYEGGAVRLPLPTYDASVKEGPPVTDAEVVHEGYCIEFVNLLKDITGLASSSKNPSSSWEVHATLTGARDTLVWLTFDILGMSFVHGYLHPVRDVGLPQYTLSAEEWDAAGLFVEEVLELSKTHNS